MWVSQNYSTSRFSLSVFFKHIHKLFSVIIAGNTFKRFQKPIIEITFLIPPNTEQHLGGWMSFRLWCTWLTETFYRFGMLKHIHFSYPVPISWKKYLFVVFISKIVFCRCFSLLIEMKPNYKLFEPFVLPLNVLLQLIDLHLTLQSIQIVYDSIFSQHFFKFDTFNFFLGDSLSSLSSMGLCQCRHF